MKTIMNLGGVETELDLALPGDRLRTGLLIDPGQTINEKIEAPEGAEVLLIDERLEIFFVGEGRVRPVRPWRFAAIVDEGWADLNLVGASCSLGPLASADAIVADRIIQNITVSLRPGVIDKDLAGEDRERLASVVEREACARIRLLVREELRRVLCQT